MEARAYVARALFRRYYSAIHRINGLQVVYKKL